MKVRVKGLALTGVLCALTLALAACGSSGSSSSSGGGGGGGGGSTLKPALDGSNQNLTDGKKGGTLTPDNYTIVFHLTGPYGTFFIGALSMPLTMPVPKEFAAPLDAKKPTTYGSTYEVASGAYMLKADAKGKFLGIGYQPGKSATLVRNPNWKASTDFRPAYLDQVNINVGGDKNVIGRQVLTGTHMLQNDTPSG